MLTLTARFTKNAQRKQRKNIRFMSLASFAKNWVYLAVKKKF